MCGQEDVFQVSGAPRSKYGRAHSTVASASAVGSVTEVLLDNNKMSNQRVRLLFVYFEYLSLVLPSEKTDTSQTLWLRRKQHKKCKT